MSSGGPTVVHITVNAKDANSFLASEGQLRGAAARAMIVARRRDI